MGNEFGHPEWIDFPREGNGWSYKYARRQWSLVDREDLKYKFLGKFDEDIIHLVRSKRNFQATPVEKLWDKDDDQVLAFKRGDLVFVFNFNPSKSFSDVQGIREYLKDGVTGFLCNPFSVEDFKNGIKKLADSDLRRRMKPDCQAMAEKFDISVSMAQRRAIYEEILNQ
jgi:hypothetical protein